MIAFFSAWLCPVCLTCLGIVFSDLAPVMLLFISVIINLTASGDGLLEWRNTSALYSNCLREINILDLFLREKLARKWIVHVVTVNRHTYADFFYLNESYRDFWSDCLKSGIVHVEDAAKENRNDGYCSSQWKWANGLLTHLFLGLNHKCLSSFHICIWDKCLSAYSGPGRSLYIWQSGSGAFDCVVFAFIFVFNPFSTLKTTRPTPFL